jgi:hypothetical protein
MYLYRIVRCIKVLVLSEIAVKNMCCENIKMYFLRGFLGSAVKNMCCERRWICICTGLSDV